MRNLKIYQFQQIIKNKILQIRVNRIQLMYINEPYLKGTSKKQSTVSKAINQFQFADHRSKRGEYDYTKQRQREEATQRKKKGMRDKSRQFEKDIQNDDLSTKMKDKYRRRKNRRGMDEGLDGILDLIDKNRNNQKNYEAQTKDERQFQQELVLELGELLRRCTSSMQRLRQKIENLDQIKETQSQIKAFKHCQHLLECENQNEQKMSKAGKEMLRKKYLQVQNYKLRILKQIGDLKQEIREIRKQAKKNEDVINDQRKSEKNKNNFREKIQQEKERIEKIKKRLMDCKEESYKQKNQFIILQAEEFKKMEEIESFQKLEQDYQQNIIRRAKYDKLGKIKEKVLHAKGRIQEEIKPHLERKINKMAQLRSELNNVDEALSLCTTKCQDQLIIIEALKEKSYHEENFRSQDSKNLFETYKNKYNSIYFGSTDGKEGQNNSWSEYSNYLKQLINRNAQLNKRVHTQLPKSGTSSVQGLRKKRNSHIGQKNNSFYIDNDVLDLRSNKNARRITGQRFYEGQSNKNKDNSKDATLKLPKLVRVDGSEQKQIKNKVKEGIKNNRGKQDDFQLQSVDSNDSKVSGSIIEVQFHKK